MTGNLLDTNIALFALGAPRRLTNAVQSAIETGSNFLSVVSYWEVTLKCAKGTLDIDDPQEWWTDALDRLKATPLVLRPEHISALQRLMPHHRDPFDRVLIAQALTEKLTVVTSDREISRYASPNLKVIR